jgi:hypothetical protein
MDFTPPSGHLTPLFALRSWIAKRSIPKIVSDPNPTRQGAQFHNDRGTHSRLLKQTEIRRIKRLLGGIHGQALNDRTGREGPVGAFEICLNVATGGKSPVKIRQSWN